MEKKLEALRREAQKNRQRSQKLQESLKKQKEEILEESDNKFEKLIDLAIEQSH